MSLKFDAFSFEIIGSNRRSVSFTGQVDPGTTLLISGVSGVGKSTFLRVLAGLHGNSGGHLYYCGRDITKLLAQVRPFSMVFQGYQLFSHLSVADNLLVSFEKKPELKMLSLDLKKARIAAMLRELNMVHLSDSLAKDLSGGEHQRVGICRALLSESPVVIFDEPTSALDLQSKSLVLQMLEKYQNKHSAIFVIVSHSKDDFSFPNTKYLEMKEDQICLEF